MARILEPYPDTVQAVTLLVEEWFPELGPREDDEFRTGRVFPPNVQQNLPFCRITDIGGNDDGLTDRPLIDIDVLAGTFADARRLAVGIQARLLGAPWKAGPVVLDNVRTAMRPHSVPWDDERVHRYYASYVVGVRR